MLFKKLLVTTVLVFINVSLYATAIDSKEKVSSSYFFTDNYYLPTALKNPTLHFQYMTGDNYQGNNYILFNKFKENPEDAIRAVLVDFILKDTTGMIANVPLSSSGDINSLLNQSKLTLSLGKTVLENLGVEEYDDILKDFINGKTLANIENISKENMQELVKIIDKPEINQNNDLLDRIGSFIKNNLTISEDGVNELSQSLHGSFTEQKAYRESLISEINRLNTKTENTAKEFLKREKELKAIVEEYKSALLKSNNATDASKKTMQMHIEALESRVKFLASDVEFLNKQHLVLGDSKTKLEITLKNNDFSNTVDETVETNIKKFNDAKLDNFKDKNFLRRAFTNTLDVASIGADIFSLSMLTYDIYSTHEIINNNIKSKLEAIKELKSLLTTSNYSDECTVNDYDCMTFKVLTEIENEFSDNSMHWIKTYMLDKNAYTISKDLVSSLDSMIQIVGTSATIAARYAPRALPSLFKGFSFYSGTIGKALGPTLVLTDFAYSEYTKDGFPKLGSQAIAAHIVYQLLGKQLENNDNSFNKKSMLLHALASDAGRYLKNIYFFTPGYDESSSTFWMSVGIVADLGGSGIACGPAALECIALSSKKYLNNVIGILAQEYAVNRNGLPDFINAYVPVYSTHYNNAVYYKNQLKNSEETSTDYLSVSSEFKIYREKISNQKIIYAIPPNMITKNLVKSDVPISYDDLSYAEETKLLDIRVLRHDSNQKVLKDIIDDQSSEFHMLYDGIFEKDGNRPRRYFKNVSRRYIDGAYSFSFSDYGMPLSSTRIAINNEEIVSNGGKIQLVLNRGTKQGDSIEFNLDNENNFIDNEVFDTVPIDIKLKKMIINGVNNKTIWSTNVQIDYAESKGFSVQNSDEPWYIEVHQEDRNRFYLYGKNSTDLQFTQLSLLSGKIYGKKIKPIKVVYTNPENSNEVLTIFDSEADIFNSILFHATARQVNEGVNKWEQSWIEEYFGEDAKLIYSEQSNSEADVIGLPITEDNSELVLNISNATIADKAVEITEVNRKIKSTIEHEYQWYKIYLKRGEGYTFLVEPHISDRELDIYLIHKDGSTFIDDSRYIQNDSEGTLSVAVGESGYYFLMIRKIGVVSGSYNLTVYPAYWNIDYSDNKVRYKGKLFQSHYYKNGSLALEEGNNWLRFEGKKGKEYTISYIPHLNRDGSLQVDLYDIDLSRLVSYRTMSNRVETMIFTIEKDGVYYLKLDAYYGGTVDLNSLDIEADTDQDNDALTATQEYSIGTNPNSRDTDQDGRFNDKEEFERGWDPTSSYPLNMSEAISSERAVEIPEVNRRITSTIKNEYQWYKIYLQRGEGYTFILEPQINDGSLYLYLYQKDGKTVMHSDFNTFNNKKVTIGESGYYYIKVLKVGAFHGSYNLTVHPAYWNTGYSDDTVNYKGENYQAHYYKNGNLVLEKGDNWLRFEGEQGKTFSITCTPHIKTWRMNISLYNEDLFRLTSENITWKETEVFTFTTNTNDVYYLNLSVGLAGSVDLSSLDIIEDTDYDEDGLTATKEYVIGTDPNKNDTDEDGRFNDKEEFERGWDPTTRYPLNMKGATSAETAVEISGVNRRIKSIIQHEYQWYKIYLKKGEGYTFVLEPQINDIDGLDLFLYDKDAKSLIGSDRRYTIIQGRRYITKIVEESGFYYVVVKKVGDAINGSYNLTAYPAHWNIDYSDNNVTFSRESYQAHYYKNGNLKIIEPYTWLRFEGKAGKKYDISITPYLNGNEDLQIHLYYELNELSFVKNSTYIYTGETETFSFITENNGVYYLKITANGDGNVNLNSLDILPDTDYDGDGLKATQEYVIGTDPIKSDTDGDGYRDGEEFELQSDPLVASSYPIDTDGDKTIDSIDTDDDNDGVLDENDAFPKDSSETLDTDGDGIGDNSDTDDDGDSILDHDDVFPLDYFNSEDHDNDGIGNTDDTDDDNDGISDYEDVFPYDSEESVDSDNDGLGDNEDTDDDNDGVSDYDEQIAGTNPKDKDDYPSTGLSKEEKTLFLILGNRSTQLNKMNSESSKILQIPTPLIISAMKKEEESTHFEVGAYGNNENISKTLTIPSAEAIDITIKGETEKNYDLIVFYDKNTGKKLVTLSGVMDTTFRLNVSSVDIVFISDDTETRNGFSIDISKATEKTDMTAWTTGIYENGVTLTKILGIEGAEFFTVTVEGETEESYDFLRVYDAASGQLLKEFSGEINETFRAFTSSSAIRVVLVSDESISKDGISIKISQ